MLTTVFSRVQAKLTVNDVGLLEHVLKSVMYLAEGGPLAWYPLPALPHQLVDLRRAAGRTLHPVHKHLTTVSTAKHLTLPELN